MKLSQEISKAEVQLCLSVKNTRKPSFTRDDLLGFGQMAFKDELEDWSAAFDSFCQRNLLHSDGEHFSLTPEGEKYAEQIVTRELFGKMFVRAERSQAFGRFCDRVYGRNLTQFGTADMEQLEMLIAVLGLNEHSCALDVGCGVGATTEYISDRTGAKITGIDLAEPCVERARERTLDKADRLIYLIANINEIDLPAESFDTVISVDTLYFAKDLPRTIGQLKTLLKRNGQMGLFFSEVITEIGGSRERLAPDQTKLARALGANGLSFTAHDLTASNLEFWRRSQSIIAEMKPEFEAEGNKDLCEGRILEGDSVLALAIAGRMSRYLYHARVSV